MNKHFEDAWYYLRRAGEHVKRGVEAEFEPVQRRVRRFRDEEDREPSTRVEKLQHELKGIEERAESEAKERLTNARQKVETYRGSGQ